MKTFKSSKITRTLTFKLASVCLMALLLSCTRNNTVDTQNTTSLKTSLIKEDTSHYKVTFIELGSVRCIPCIKMQPIIKSIETNYANQVNVVFHDVWTPEGKEAAKQYTFNVIPTQLFLDKDGKEYFRHEGFFPEEELIKILQQKGVN
ncbi:MAG: thioredoxin family protein [Cytophagales bacterium]|nr:thioredoxin family protein [Cytophagales bacterium]